MVKTICTPQSNNGEENIKSPNIFMAVYYELSDFCTNGQISGLWQNRHVTQDKCYMRYLWRSGHLIIYWGIQFCAWRLSLLYYRIQNIMCMVTRTSLCPFVPMRSNAQVFRDLLFSVDTSEEVTNLGYLPGGVNCTRTMWSSYCTAALRSIILGSGQSWCLYILSSSFWPSLRMSWCGGGGGAASAGQHSMSLSVWITARPLLAASPAPHTLYSLHIFRWCKNWTGRGFYEIWRYGHFPGNQAAVPGSQSAGCRGPAWETWR